MIREGMTLKVETYFEDSQWVRLVDDDGNTYEGVIVHKNGSPVSFIPNWHTVATLMDAYNIDEETAKKVLERLTDDDYYVDSDAVDVVIGEVLKDLKNGA